MYKAHGFVVDQEVSALEVLEKNPGVVTLLEAIETPKYVHLVIEFLAGGSLTGIVGNGKKLAERESLRLFHQICSGLSHLHSRHAIHRDLKLDNLMLDAERNSRIVDFGLATISAPGDILHEVCGTPEYQSPELHRRLPHIGCPLDVWSLGVVLCAMLDGELPFTGINKQHVAKRVMRGIYQLPEASKDTLGLLEALLAENPSNRPRAQEILHHPCLTSL